MPHISVAPLPPAAAGPGTEILYYNSTGVGQTGSTAKKLMGFVIPSDDFTFTHTTPESPNATMLHVFATGQWSQNANGKKLFFQTGRVNFETAFTFEDPPNVAQIVYWACDVRFMRGFPTSGIWAMIAFQFATLAGLVIKSYLINHGINSVPAGANIDCSFYGQSLAGVNSDVIQDTLLAYWIGK